MMTGSKGATLAETGAARATDAHARDAQRHAGHVSGHLHAAADAQGKHVQHGHAHRHARGHEHVPPRLPPSLLRLPLASRAMIAAVAIAAIWAVVLAVMQ